MQINDKTLSAILNLFHKRRQTQIDLEERYQTLEEGVPIFTRRYYIGDTDVTDTKIVKRINNDFFKEIVDTKTGFMCGIPVSVTIPREKYSPAEFDAFNEAVKKWSVINDLANVDSDCTKYASTMGYAGRLLHLDKDGEVRVRAIPGYQCFFLGENPYRADLAVRVYTSLSISDDGISSYTYYADMYDASYKYSFKGSMTTRPASARTVDPDIISVQWELIDKTLHYFDGVPLLKWRNNDSEKGDAENVLSLIDLYDETVSDLAAENEQFRLAYMVFKGQKPELETLDALKRTGALWMGGDNDEVSFLTKTVEATSIFTFLTKLEGNILHFAQSINLREEAFAGNLSGVALSYKTRNFENNCKTTELENKASLREMWRLILAMWKLKNIGDWDYTDLQFNFVRNYPRNTLEESQTTMNLKGMVSEQTRLSQLSFVEDAVAEEEQMKKETEGLIDISMLRDKMTQNTDSEEIEDGVQTEETKTTEKIKLKRPVKRPTE